MPLTEAINFYKVIPEKYLKPVATYPRYADLKLELPIRAVIAGSSGTGKSNTVMNVIHEMDCFNRFYLFIADKHEALYSHLIDYVVKNYGKNAISVSDDINAIPPINKIDPSKNNLFIIDDLINEKLKTPHVLNLFTNGRKQNASILYISQDFFKLNNTVRKNSTIVILTKFNRQDDLKRILDQYRQHISPAGMLNLYKYAISKGSMNYFMIDTVNEKWRYRANFNPIPHSSSIQ